MAADEDQLPQQMQRLTRVMALLLIQGKNQTEAIRLLGRAGLNRKEIAAVCGTTPDVVSVRLAEAKRRR